MTGVHGVLRSLTARLVLAMAGVALGTALLAGLLTAPLLGSATEDAVRDPLARQADLLALVAARVPSEALTSGGFGRFGPLVGRAGLSIGTVAPDGTRTGAAEALDDDEVADLLAGRDVSTDGRLDGDDVLVEARPTPAGGAIVLASESALVDETAATLRRRVVLAIGLGLLGALAVALLVATRLGNPLTRTAAAARRLAEGERGVELPSSGTREVADVTTALGTLDRALATSEGRQRDFLLSVSHELRTPLTAVRGYAEALADGVVPTSDTRDVARTMVAETQRLERYVGDLLALARLQADDFAVEREPVDVGVLLAAAARAWGERAGRAGVTVRAQDEGAVAVLSDATRLRQVVDALVDNAVRVCAAGDEVVLATVAEADGVRVEVRDSGPGLTEDDAAVAFEPGVLHERYAGTRPGGHGLGLAVVDRLVTRLGGSVTLTTAPEGGACFAVHLPK